MTAANGQENPIQQRSQDVATANMNESEGNSYRRLVEISFDGIIVYRDDRIVLINLAGATLLGAETPEQLVGKPIRDFVHPDHRQIVELSDPAVKEEEPVAPLIEGKLVRLDGAEVDVELTTASATYESKPVVQIVFRDITERNRLTHEIEERRLYLESVLTYAPDAIVTLDAQHNIREWNPGAEWLFGYTPDEAVGRNIDELITGSNGGVTGEATALTQQVLAGLGVSPREGVRYRKDGTPVNVILAGSPILIGGQVAGVVAVYTDITERKQAEEALWQYTERLRTLRLIDGIILAAWSAEEIAQAALRHIRPLVPHIGAGVVLFDFEAQEATVFATQFSGAANIAPGTRIPMGTLSDIDALKQGQTVEVKDLSVYPQSLPSAQAMLDMGVQSYIAAPLIAHGQLIGALALAADRPDAFAPQHIDIIREIANQIAVALRQAHLRAALQTEQQRLQALLAHLPEGVLLLDNDYCILVVNPAAETYLHALMDGTDSSAVGVGTIVTRLATRPVGELLRLPSGGLWHTLELAGPPHLVYEMIARPMTAQADVGGWVVLIREVTAEREALDRSHRQERLAAVGQLAGGIAHDFNNLLTTIMLYAQLPLGRADLPPMVARALETILSESRRAAELIQQILDFSRRSPIETQPIDLKPLIKETVRVLRRTIPENIPLRLAAAAEAYIVNADPTRIQQVLMNLVLNARDAMPDGGVVQIELSEVTVAPGEEAPVVEMATDHWVCLSVSDTGIGITPDALPRIFEPFFTTKPLGEGAGLGLAQVYGIVTQHQGYIRVETEVSKGTMFYVYLPAFRAIEDEVSHPRTVGTIPLGKGEIILLVEDNDRLREVAQSILDTLGYQVLAATDGREALTTYKSAEKVDLLITDVVMPRMGGRELVQELRKIAPNLKTLAITGHILEKDLDALREEGVLDIIYKPLDMDVLAQAIRTALDTN